MPRDADPAVATAVRVVRAVALLVVGVIVVVVFVEPGDDGEPDAEPPAAAAGVAPAGGQVETVLAERAEALAGADGRHRAAVSLVSYRSLDGVQRVAARGRVEPAELLVAVPGGEPDVVAPGELDAWVARRRAELEGERAAIAEVLETVEPDDPFAATYARDLQRLDDVVAALDADAEVVYGFVTEASVEALRDLAARADVRLVDLGPVLAAGLRPEEETVVGDPPTRP